MLTAWLLAALAGAVFWVALRADIAQDFRPEARSPAVHVFGDADGTVATAALVVPVAPPGDGDRSSVAIAVDADHPDASWLVEARPAQGDLMLQLLRSPEKVREVSLLRSRLFNPRDEWIDPAQRQAIANIVAELAPLARTAADELGRAIERDFAAARNRGKTQIIDLQRPGGSLLLMALGPDPFQLTIDGMTHGVACEWVTDAVVRRQHHRQLGCGLAQRLARAFQGAGTLTREEADALCERAARTVRSPR